MSQKTLYLLTGAIGAFVSALPASVRSYVFVVFLFVFVDTMTGVAASIMSKEMRSGHMRSKMIAKPTQYTILSCLSWGAFIITNA